MQLADIRTRLAGLEGRSYWRSLEELAETPEFRQYVEREFPFQASEFTDPAGRRNFLKLMGASLALAGVSACTRQPAEALVPYVRQPEEIIPGRPLFFATAMPQGGLAMPVLAENHMGRPTKLEGNPEHPASLGATDVLAQASVLTLYDPDRSRTVLNRGSVKTWSNFTEALSLALGPQRTSGGTGLRLLTEPVSSPSLLAQMAAFTAAFPEARWHQWDPVYGAAQGGAPSAHAIYRFDRADVIVALDADFLGFGAASVRYSRDFASRRRLGTPNDLLNRLYAIESTLTMTGTAADHRRAVRPRDVHGIANALAAALGVPEAPAAGGLDAGLSSFVAAVAADLKAHAGRSVVVAGEMQPAAVHAAARAINDLLGNTGETVTYTTPVVGTPVDGTASLAELVRDMEAGTVEVLVVIGTNPLFTAPADLNFKAAFEKIPARFHMGLYVDETAELSHWHAPEAHYLESWGDIRAFDGSVSLIQPLIAPLYDGHAAIELLASINGQGGQPLLDLVKGYWTSAFDGTTADTWTLRDRHGNPFTSVDAFWRHALHDGFLAGTSYVTGATPPPAPAADPMAPAETGAVSGIDVVFRPDPYLLDGRYANNGWLQELPRPLSKVTWDSTVHVSVTTAARLGVGRGDIVEIALQGRTTRVPVWVQPGTPDDVAVVYFGFGRTTAGRVGGGVGFDTFPLRSSAAPWFESGAQVTRTGESYTIATTQNHFAMEDRYPVRVVDAEAYRENPDVVRELKPLHVNPMLSMYPDHEYKGYKWGMAIDLNACNGCSACIVACVAENNIPVVGKSQVAVSREMHWLRVDTYFDGDPAAPSGVYNQPLACVQCEQAPCEPVCPVAATVHSDEGLNDMVYNRCVGTRYCANNCPYKVRRFNFLLYSDFTTKELEPVRNPDVTIRSRGVMEKCTYCVQRINQARIDAKTEGRSIRDGEIKTACEQVCPSEAIVFGDLNDPGSRVVQLKAQQRNYALLDDLGTRPRTTYLAKVRNPNPALVG
ncbi:MAG: molybdopterin oxidoreductase [Acidobacteria bacterium SCN 69-37]|nr:MAG: molybdopterin oxidoreductase [Acidobacteria bacterium SCN 69-37]